MAKKKKKKKSKETKHRIAEGSRPRCSRCKRRIFYMEDVATYGGDKQEYYDKDYYYLCKQCHKKEGFQKGIPK